MDIVKAINSFGLETVVIFLAVIWLILLISSVSHNQQETPDLKKDRERDENRLRKLKFTLFVYPLLAIVLFVVYLVIAF